jgi:hypothetical protein
MLGYMNFFFFSAGDQTLGLLCAKQSLYQATFPTPV